MNIVTWLFVPVSVVLLTASCSNMRPQLDRSKGVFPATSITNFITQADIRIDGYTKAWKRLEAYEWQIATTSLGGGAIAVVGAVAQSTPWAVAGAATAGAATMYSSFYGTERQNDAFTKASQATTCLRALAENIKSPNLSTVDAPEGWDEDAESYSIRLLNTGISRIDDTLFTRLRKRAVSTEPDFASLQASLTRAMSSKPSLLKKGATAASDSSRLQAAVGRLESDIGICISAN
ncbi:hypothetical protein [Pseudomonas sp. 3-2]|uniref:hypothetical protein n=1 Tax=Pseudomonas sp. 3-2 TaxID=2867408 RepID=UPI001C86E7A5|nr:hypothetical protein [Pseudomonas sp. 3-2]QZD73252.1 hypothetical protein K3819_10465 [Pseudomonas sp. 3-2]